MKTTIKELKELSAEIKKYQAEYEECFAHASAHAEIANDINDASGRLCRLINDIQYDDNTITINVVEVASELAKEKMCDVLLDDYKAIYGEHDNGTYTEEAQSIFDEYYDEFYDLLLKSN